jgi:hypothetical protein
VGNAVPSVAKMFFLSFILGYMQVAVWVAYPSCVTNVWCMANRG